ncbi:MAG: redox-sensing transcriptional repressor Rex [Anaerolineales bacterium]|jgi:redox-sensing transcriptional repressor
MKSNAIPDIIISRLPLYLRSLQRMQEENRKVTSSQELGERLGISAAQIRKDLSQFGEFGKQGTGYKIDYLIEQLSKILQVDQEWDIVVVGAGDIGNAVARYRGFRNRGFKVKMIFDNDQSRVGTEIDAYIVKDSKNLISYVVDNNIKIAMIAVPASHAQEVANQLVEAGIKAILNYAPINITVPDGVFVQYIDPSIHLQRMTYYLD